jgi:hypothetical protein
MWSLLSNQVGVYAFVFARVGNTEPETFGARSNSPDHALQFTAIRASERFQGRGPFRRCPARSPEPRSQTRERERSSPGEGGPSLRTNQISKVPLTQSEA